MADQQSRSGEDVTALMNGEDVTALMNAPQIKAATPMGRVFIDAMRKKGIEPTQAKIDSADRMAEGVLGGGVMTAAPAAAKEGVTLLQGLGKRMYRGLLKPSVAVRKEFGEDVGTGLLEKRRLITRGGADAAESAVDASAKVADDMITGAPRPSQGVSADRVIKEFSPVLDAVKARVDAGVVSPSELDKVVQRVQRIRQTANASGGRIDPVRSQTLKKTAQEAAEGSYAQMQGRSKKMLDTDDLLDAATARGFKGGLEDIIPGIGQQNSATQKLIGESRALAEGVGRTSNHLPFGSVSDLASMSVGAANPLLGVAGKMSTMAGPGSAMAIGANELGKRGADDAMQRALMVFMNQIGTGMSSRK